MSGEALRFGPRGLLGGALLLALVHLVWAWPVYVYEGAPATKDLVLSYQPMHSVLAEQAWPPYRLWEPRGGCGFPMLAESQSSQLYPLSVAARRFLDPGLGLFPLLYFHLWLSGVFMLALGRELRLRLDSAWIAALAWMGCGFMVSHLGVPPMLFQATWVPAAAAAFTRHFRTGRWLPLGVAGVCLGSMLLAGHYQVSAYGMLFLAAWCGWAPSRLGAGRSRLAGLAAFALAAGLAVAFSWVQLGPSLDFLALTGRAETGGGLWLSWFPPQLLSLALPFAFGVAVRPVLVGGVPEGLDTYWGAGVYWETALYIGLVPVFLALLSWRGRRGGWERLLWVGLGLSLALAAGKYLPWNPPLWRLPLWGSFRFPSRLLVVAHFCLALLAGFGVERLHQLGSDALRRWGRRVAWGSVSLLGLLTLGWIVASALASSVEPVSRRATLAAGTLFPAATPNLHFLLWAGLLAGCLTLAGRRPRLRTPLPWALAAVAAADLTGHFLAQRALVSSDFYRRPPTALPGCGDTEPGYRYFSVARYHSDPVDHQLELLPASLNLRTACSTVDYRGSLYDRRFSRYFEALMEGYTEPDGGMRPRPRRLELFALAGVRHLARRQPLEAPEHERVTSLGASSVYRLGGTVPLLRRVPRATWVADGDEAWRGITSPGFVAGRDLILEAPPTGVDRAPSSGEELAAKDHDTSAGRASGVVELLSQGPGRLELLTSGPEDAWLVWSQTWSPKWRAWLDGKDQTVLRANYLFQAVAVPAGSHRVRLEYREPALRHGAVSAALGLGVCVLLGWLDLRRRRSDRLGRVDGLGRQSPRDTVGY